MAGLASVDVVSNMERGISLPSYETLGRLADKLGVPMRELMEAVEGDSAGDPERVELEARLTVMGRSLDKRNLRIALEQMAVLSKYERR